MPLIERSALVNHSAGEMFDLVNDVASYPQFMPGCKDARILSESKAEMVAELTLAKSGISQRFTTRNRLSRPERIDMELVDGNFSNFAACWQFVPLQATACKVSLRMEFEFAAALFDRVTERLFAELGNAQVDSLVARADTIYGS